MRTLPIGQHKVSFNNFKSESKDAKVTQVLLVKDPQVTEKPSREKKIALVSAAVAVASLGVALYAHKNNKALKEEVISKAKDKAKEVEKKAEEAVKKAEEAAKRAEENAKTIEEKQKWNDGYHDGIDEKIKNIDNKTNEIAGKISSIETNIPAGLMERGMVNIDGLTLMQNMKTDAAIPVTVEMQEYLKTLSSKYQKGEMPLNRLTKDSIVWSISTETKWRGTGGQGEIFTQQAKNFREVGVKAYSILAGNQLAGKGGIHTVDGETYCYYDSNKIPLKKVVEFPVDSYRGNRHSLENITVYSGVSPMSKEQILIMSNPKYFSSTSFIYGNSAGGVTERERATMLGKAMFQLEKLIRDPKSVPEYTVYNSEILNSIKAPDGVYLHDASAAPYIVMARYLAPLQAANSELSSDAAEAISRKNIVAKFHNLDYRGEGWGSERSDILNTAFDKYAADIYRYAETGFGKEEGMSAISNTLVSSGATNFDNWILSLVNNGENVSKTDLLERIASAKRSGSLQHILDVRYNAGTIRGHGNSWDRSANEVSVDNIKTFNKMINNDKFTILSREIKMLKKALPDEKGLSEIKVIDIETFNDVIKILRKIENPLVKDKLKELDEMGVTTMRSYVPYVQSDSNEVIMKARKQNKMLFIEQLRTMLKYNETTGTKTFKLVSPEGLNLEEINMNNIDDLVIASFGCRLVEQKNVPLLMAALEEIHKEFETKYPGKKLLTVIGGPDDTASGDFHKMIAKNIGNNIAVQERTPNPIYQSASDFTLRTSAFEPDGDTAESLYKGTPLVLTRVGGYVDRIDGTGKGFLSKRTPVEAANTPEGEFKTMVQDYKEAFFEAVDVKLNRPEEYENMVRKCIDSEYSWIIKDSDNKIARNSGIARDLEMLGFDLDTFPEFASKN